MNKTPRLTASDSLQDMIVKMSDGNPGAVSVMINLVEKALNPMDAFLRILDLDDMSLYGSTIWVAFKDVCEENLELLEQKIKDRSIEQEVKAIA